MHRRRFAFIDDVSSHGSVNQLLIALAKVYLHGANLELFLRMLRSMNDSKNAAANKIFESLSKDFNKASFQLGLAE
jgi:hypothetical protein